MRELQRDAERRPGVHVRHRARRVADERRPRDRHVGEQRRAGLGEEPRDVWCHRLVEAEHDLDPAARASGGGGQRTVDRRSHADDVQTRADW